jgi:hypothetical protein
VKEHGKEGGREGGKEGGKEGGREGGLAIMGCARRTTPGLNF